MGFIRLLTIIFIIWLVIYLARRLLQNRSKEKQQKPKRQIGNMVQCKTCGLHIPETEAIRENGDVFCCEEHRKSS